MRKIWRAAPSGPGRSPLEKWQTPSNRGTQSRGSHWDSRAAEGGEAARPTVGGSSERNPPMALWNAGRPGKATPLILGLGFLLAIGTSTADAHPAGHSPGPAEHATQVLAGLSASYQAGNAST